MSNMWSGPSRALQFHLDLYERVDRVFTYLANLPEGQSVVNSETMPRQLTQRLRLMTASSPDVRLTDGDSVALRKDAYERMFDERNFERTSMALKAELVALDQGETHYVSHSVMNSVLLAAETMETEALHATDLPCPAGVIVFEHPLLTDDLHPETGEVVPGLHMPTRAIAWSPSNVVISTTGEVRQGICYTLYSETESYKAWYISSYRRIFGEDEMDLLTDSADDLRSWATDTSGWAFSAPWDHDKFGAGVSYIRRFLLAYWRWTWQRILVPTPYTPTRAERKWVSRIGKPPLQDGHIKVLRLRREIEHERKYGTEYQGIYDHQFMVRGHWRRQWYKTLGPATIDGEFNHESHRLVWVEPFVKGNPNGPLVLGHNVTSAVR